MNVWYVNSILGTFRLEEEDNAICGLALCPDGVPELEPLPRKVCETPLLQEAEEQLNEYFAGARREFDLPLAPKGTPFQKAVWAEMCRIPYGETRTYGQLAAAIGIFSGKFIFIFVLQKSLQAFLKHIFHRRVAVGNCIIHKRAIAHPFCAMALFSLRFTVRCTRCPSSRNCPRCTWRGFAGR